MLCTAMPTRARDLKKRALVRLLKELARKYHVQVAVTQIATDETVLQAFKRVACKAHPDKGGTKEDAQRLNAARAEWDQAKKEAGRPGRKAGPRPPSSSNGLKKYTAL